VEEPVEIRDLLADERCGRAVLDFLSSTNVGRLVAPLEANDTGRKVSEWELWERWEQEEERRADAETLGLRTNRARRIRSSFPRARSWNRQRWDRGGVRFLLCSPLYFPCVISFLRSRLSRQDRAEGQGEHGTYRRRADSGQENWAKMDAAKIYIG